MAESEWFCKVLALYLVPECIELQLGLINSPTQSFIAEPNKLCTDNLVVFLLLPTAQCTLVYIGLKVTPRHIDLNLFDFPNLDILANELHLSSLKVLCHLT